MTESPWSQSSQAILEHFNVDPHRGLSADHAAKHVELYGKNGSLYVDLAMKCGLTI